MSWWKACRGTRISSYLHNIHRTSLPTRTVPLLGPYTHGASKGNHHHHLPRRIGLWGSSSSFLSSMLHGGAHCQYSTQSITETKSKKMLYYLTAVVFGMVGLTYAAVPLYRTFCQATGYGGTVQRKEYRLLRRRLLGIQNLLPSLKGESKARRKRACLLHCESSAPITGVSTYNVTPMKAGVYFNKIQCFCFEEQRLLPGEQLDVPVFFYIDPEFETDPRMDGINNLILSYTFFKVSESK